MAHFSVENPSPNDFRIYGHHLDAKGGAVRFLAAQTWSQERVDKWLSEWAIAPDGMLCAAPDEIKLADCTHLAGPPIENADGSETCADCGKRFYEHQCMCGHTIEDHIPEDFDPKRGCVNVAVDGIVGVTCRCDHYQADPGYRGVGDSYQGGGVL